MMKKFFIGLFILAMLVSLPGLARARGDKGKTCNDKHASRAEMKNKHYQMKIDNMQILIDTMTILKDLNHKPTAEEKEKLASMIEKLQANITECKTRKDKHKGKHAQNPCSEEELGY